ncbi:GSCOCG00006579001-RA-CDS [Cotesia congregata]|nr:GSCOCG00006579001-RA-CDS [Cotesia congregata]
MKVIIIFVTLLVVNQVIGSSIETKNETVLLLVRSLSSQLYNFLEYDLREIMRYGSPVFDPYEQSQQKFQYNDNKLSFKGTFDDFSVENLSYYNVKKATVGFWTRKVDVDLYFSSILSRGFYDVNFYYDSTPYVGKGQYKVNLKGLKIYIEAWVSIWGHLHVTYLNTYLSLESFEFSGSNKLLNQNDTLIWNQKISKLVPKIIKEDHNALASSISKKLIVFINQNL